MVVKSDIINGDLYKSTEVR